MFYIFIVWAVWFCLVLTWQDLMSDESRINDDRDIILFVLIIMSFILCACFTVTQVVTPTGAYYQHAPQ